MKGIEKLINILESICDSNEWKGIDSRLLYFRWRKELILEAPSFQICGLETYNWITGQFAESKMPNTKRKNEFRNPEYQIPESRYPEGRNIESWNVKLESSKYK